MRGYSLVFSLGLSFTCIDAVPAQVLPEPGLLPDVCRPTATPDPVTWVTSGSGPFTFQLPRSAVSRPIRDIDSMRSAWSHTDGWEVITDYGEYTEDFSSREEEFGGSLVRCQEAQSTQAPEIVVYRTGEGRHAAGLYWIDPSNRGSPAGQGTRRPTALWIRGVSDRAEDLGTVLAILYSVRLR